MRSFCDKTLLNACLVQGGEKKRNEILQLAVLEASPDHGYCVFAQWWQCSNEGNSTLM